ncbi:phage tail protein [Nitrosomonas sp.]|uniref:phage tail protein n=1 Tax=Nitrosomonas sp. TaxID=42353 RepID=UPI0025E35AC5|nr:phage tail protein [Nitrosomonas sp.]
MSSIYYTLLTNAGASAMAYAAAHASAVDLAEVALGDGSGSLPTHTPASTTLVNEVYRASINSITQDPENAAWYIVELVVPPEVGDFWVREFRIDDAAGNPIYIGVTAPEFKPILASGMTRDSIYRLIVETSNAAEITLVIDPSIVMATHAYVLNALSAYIPLTQRAAALGVGTLDSSGKQVLSQVPDSVVTDTKLAAFYKNTRARRYYFANI